MYGGPPGRECIRQINHCIQSNGKHWLTGRACEEISPAAHPPLPQSSPSIHLCQLDGSDYWGEARGPPQSSKGVEGKRIPAAAPCGSSGRRKERSRKEENLRIAINEERLMIEIGGGGGKERVSRLESLRPAMLRESEDGRGRAPVD
ncbi:hypothetical protein ACLOJK_031153 [Asimina triloba]